MFFYIYTSPPPFSDLTGREGRWACLTGLAEPGSCIAHSIAAQAVYHNPSEDATIPSQTQCAFFFSFFFLHVLIQVDDSINGLDYPMVPSDRQLEEKGLESYHRLISLRLRARPELSPFFLLPPLTITTVAKKAPASLFFFWSYRDGSESVQRGVWTLLLHGSTLAAHPPRPRPA